MFEGGSKYFLEKVFDFNIMNNYQTLKTKKMSYKKTLFPLISLAFLLTCFSCDLLRDAEGGYTEPDPCDKTKIENEEERTFEISCHVTDQNGDPVSSVTVVYDFIKEYCDGTLKGDFSFTDTPNENGYSSAGNWVTYKYNNELDHVFVKVYIEGSISSSVDEVFYWDDVDEEYILDLANRKKIVKSYEITHNID
ncbi:hypothetical protein PbJCM13498_02360 [Prolixibacter bellariivorans]|uniref:Uncharacterized protein n=2 Tax=Prolixibacter bellariivorans TaxID=314319 RepID=A0A5M4AUS4_9BACT|nr:hypothetical protein PbJCM13498_02360 [Prolixibacter bellariivorans]